MLGTRIPKVDAREIAWWAETAHGFTGKDLKLVLTEDDKCVLKEQAGPSDQVLVEVSSSNVVPNRLTRPKIEVQPPGCPKERVEEKGDALFWTESSIEKFLFPYYYAQRLLTDEEMADLKKSYANRKVVAFIHIPPSQTMAIHGKDTVMVLEAKDGDELAWTPLTDYLSTL